MISKSIHEPDGDAMEQSIAAPAGHPPATHPRERRGEEGYILIGVLFLVVLVLIALSIAAPKVAADLERDREIELMHRGKQYERAIKLYYRKFNAYPPNMEALEKSNEIRFLRRRYRDPITRKDEWHLIHFGEAKTPSMGFFGQPIAGTGGAGGSLLAGTGPGGIGQNIGSPIGGSVSPGGSSGIGSTTTPTDPSSTTPANPGSPTTPSDPSQTTTGGQSGTTGSQTGTTGGSIFGSSSTTGSGQTFGGGGIIGVESTSPKKAILEYKKKTHFNEWEFVYDPLADRMQMSGNLGTIGQPAAGAGNSIGNGTQSPSTQSPSLTNQPQTQQPSPNQPTPTQPQQ